MPGLARGQRDGRDHWPTAPQAARRRRARAGSNLKPVPGLPHWQHCWQPDGTSRFKLQQPAASRQRPGRPGHFQVASARGSGWTAAAALGPRCSAESRRYTDCRTQCRIPRGAQAAAAGGARAGAAPFRTLRLLSLKQDFQVERMQILS